MSEAKTPQVRLEGFSGAWGKDTVNNVAKIGNGRDYKHLSLGNIPVYGTGGYMLSVNDALSFEDDAIGIGRKGTIDKPYILEAPFWTVDTLFYVVPNSSTHLRFLQAQFERVDWKSKDASTGVPSLSKDAIYSTCIASPELAEQQQIGSFFSRLDELISQHRRKHEKLQQAKAALMQQMFPRDGADEPKLRFEGFSGAWERKKLTDEVAFYPGLTYTPSDVVRAGGILVLRSSNVQDSRIVTDDCVYVHASAVNVENVRNDDIIMVVRNGSRSLIGKHALIKRDMPSTVIGAFMTGIRARQPSFANALLSTRLFNDEVAKSMGATINQITGSMLEQMSFLFPDYDEQRQIGTLFSKIDTLISAERTYIDKLQQVKTALLQKMLI